MVIVSVLMPVTILLVDVAGHVKMRPRIVAFRFPIAVSMMHVR
jgi:hypothetical protein